MKRFSEKSPGVFGGDRSALVVVVLFVLFVLSIPKFNFLAVVVFAAFPVFVMGAANVPAGMIAKRLLQVSPFVLFMAAGNIFIDRTPLLRFFGVTITGGMVSGGVIAAKTLVTVAGVLSVMYCIPFYRICRALESFRVPEVLVTQLMLLYRYSSVLGEEAVSMQKARDMRSFGTRGKGIFRTAALIGSLLLRTMNRAERVYRSMSARGFQSRMSGRSATGFGYGEWVHIGVWSLCFLALRLIF
ncbi:MAG: cobalt ECF transporter T component CbiQ [Chlorobiaceae bacterium]